MEEKYSIDEILLAVTEIQNKKKEKEIESNKRRTVHKEFSEVPKNTLKLIEEAEKIKN
tara:strand:- start:393 stop:566 length:174 start_codon:yes stop_codon:yes gene_type:complete